MNITHVVENLNRGGLERMVIELAKFQQSQGHCCQVVCLYERGVLADELDAQDIPVHACGKRRGPDPRALLRMRRAVRMHDTEVLHTHNAMAHYQAMLATLHLPLKRVVNSRHGMGASSRTARREWLYRHSLARTDAVVAVCAAACDNAVARGIVPVTKARVVRNGIRVENYSPANAKMHTRLCMLLGIPDGTRIVGSIGRLNWAKDQAGLIHAYARVQRELPAVALMLAGDGELRSELERCASEQGIAANVHFLGDRNDVHELLQGLDLFVLSSVSEGYSMALLEACASQLPIVATDVGGNREIICNGRTGALVRASDPVALATAMLDLLRDDAKAAAYAAAARAWVAVEGSLTAMAARYEALYANPSGQCSA